MHRKRIGIGALAALMISTWAASGCMAADAKETKAAPETPQQREARMKWWREARFGMFIHWGPVSLKGTEIGWSRGGERRGIGGTGEIPLDVYDNLYKTFNPTKFDAKAWVALAKRAGMKYMVFTTRHHDGFSEWDTKQSDYNIMHSPYGKDIVRQLADACHKAGMKLGFYYSQPDWHNADYLTATHSKYLEYMKGQLRELCTNYGKVDIIWFDGLQGNSETWDSINTIAMIRKLQPGVIINNRAGLAEDFDTPEQSIGGFKFDRPWETCMTIGTQWAYKPNDNIKTTAECLRTLIRCAGGDGNLLLNVGPMPSGEIERFQIARLQEMGDFLKVWGESIYGTRGGPYKPTSTFASTRKGSVIYLHFMGPVTDVTLAPLPLKIKSAVPTFPGGRVSFTQTDEGVSLHIYGAGEQVIDSIVKLTVDGSAMDIPAVAAIKPMAKLPNGTKVSASNIYQDNADFGPEKAFDRNPDTRWATDSGVKQAWLSIEFEKPTKVSSIEMSEEFDRVKAFELQYQEGSDWKTIFNGTTIGNSFKTSFDPITAKAIRLNITQADDGPTFWEIAIK
ncbi:MAG: alpha-L-fucosidase [Armatimonadetes bacterium]|nr:alpha-L-fucosidase [Armatimonadota bacterium]